MRRSRGPPSWASVLVLLAYLFVLTWSASTAPFESGGSLTREDGIWLGGATAGFVLGCYALHPIVHEAGYRLAAVLLRLLDPGRSGSRPVSLGLVQEWPAAPAARASSTDLAEPRRGRGPAGSPPLSSFSTPTTCRSSANACRARPPPRALLAGRRAGRCRGARRPPGSARRSSRPGAPPRRGARRRCGERSASAPSSAASSRCRSERCTSSLRRPTSAPAPHAAPSTDGGERLVGGVLAERGRAHRGPGRTRRSRADGVVPGQREGQPRARPRDWRDPQAASRAARARPPPRETPARPARAPSSGTPSGARSGGSNTLSAGRWPVVRHRPARGDPDLDLERQGECQGHDQVDGVEPPDARSRHGATVLSRGGERLRPEGETDQSWDAIGRMPGRVTVGPFASRGSESLNGQEDRHRRRRRTARRPARLGRRDVHRRSSWSARSWSAPWRRLVGCRSCAVDGPLGQCGALHALDGLAGDRQGRRVPRGASGGHGPARRGRLGHRDRSRPTAPSSLPTA